MNFLSEIVSDLHKRHLLPVVVVLLVAVVAVPVFISKETKPAVRISDTDKKDSQSGPVPPLVTAADGAVINRRELKAFERKNPFIQQKVNTADGDGSVEPITDDGSGSTTPESTPSGGGSEPLKTTTSTDGGEVKYYRWTVDLRFGVVDTTSDETTAGVADDEKLYREMMVLEQVPSSDNPVLTFLGVSSHSPSAVFLVDQGVKHEGDEGACRPSPTTCTYLFLRADKEHNEHILYRDPKRKYGVKLKSMDLEVMKRKSSTKLDTQTSGSGATGQ